MPQWDTISLTNGINQLEVLPGEMGTAATGILVNTLTVSTNWRRLRCRRWIQILQYTVHFYKSTSLIFIWKLSAVLVCKLKQDCQTSQWIICLLVQSIFRIRVTYHCQKVYWWPRSRAPDLILWGHSSVLPTAALNQCQLGVPSLHDRFND